MKIFGIKEMWIAYCKTCEKELYRSPGKVFSEVTGRMHREGARVHNRHTDEIIEGGNRSHEVVLTEEGEKQQ